MSGHIPQLVLITDSTRLEHERFFAVVKEALAGGVETVLVREKAMNSARLLAFASALRELTSEAGARLIVHTQADVAKAVRADGVHVTAAEMTELPAMRRWLADETISLSTSCHHAGELQRAFEHGADFALLSPVFPTASHPGAAHLGVEGFQKLAAAAPLPVIALGGITPENRDEIAEYGVAVISAILEAEDPRHAAEKLRSG
ncbi:MAG: thiamine phosphate synthase [Mariprofundaceae bacterium]|nr:thiamine phosphate synthase [Mariprofundaceae bacterium]